MAASAADAVPALAGGAAVGVGGNAQLGDEQFSSAKVESEIPDELKEYPAPESLNALDKHMDALLEDIKILIDARNKEFQISGESRNRMPLLPSLTRFETYKSDRKDNLEGILKVEMPSRKVGSSELIQKEMKYYWNIDEAFDSDHLFGHIMSFYKEKAQKLLQENELLMSRWTRFCRTAFDASKFYYLFKVRQDRLLEEFTDAANRYERLFVFDQLRTQKKREQQAAEDAARIDAERRGLAVIKNKGPANAKKNEQQQGKNDQDRFATLSEDMSFFGSPELGDNPGFDVQDLTIYLRWLISMDRERQNINIFLGRSKILTQTDRRQLLKDYSVLSRLEPGDDAVEDIEHFEGLSVFINNPPIKSAKIEDFITEYDLLVAHWTVETPINQEDGRPFAYEIDHKFFENFSEQTMEVSLAPYEVLKSTTEGSEPAEKTATTHFSGSSGIDALVSSLASVSGYAQKLGQKATKFPKLRHASWIDNIVFVPEFDSWQEAYRHKLSNMRDTDMELRLEHDLLLSQDHEHVGAQLKDIAKRIWERAAQVPNSRPLNIKVSIIPQQREYKPKEAGENRAPKSFDFGLRNPPEIEPEEAPKSAILASKKRDYAIILKANDDNRRLEMELQNADPGHIIEGANVITPTIATIFAEHEVFAYLQMRFIKVREVRIKVLRQFNFLRSIEKRLNLDWQKNERQRKRDDQNDARILVGQMWRRAEFIDIGSTSEESAKNKPATENRTQSIQDYLKEDIPSYADNKIQLTDEKGISFVYDTALSDLEQFDNEMIKILTHYINQGRIDDHISHEYIDELRFRMANRRTEVINVTYYNPEADRTQMMLEFYEAHLRYQYAKIELVNAYLEAYEHTTEVDRARELAQIITNIIQNKPILDLSKKYFGGCYGLATRSLELHARLVISAMRHILSVQRNWCRRYTPRSSPIRKRSSMQTGNSDKAGGLNDSLLNNEDHETAVPLDGQMMTPPLSSLRDRASLNPKSPEAFYDSVLKIGLPSVEGPDSQSIVMHHPEMSVYMTEIVPALENVIQIYHTVNTASSELSDVIDTLLGSSNRAVKKTSDCVALRLLNVAWDALADFNFQMPSRARRIAGNIDSSVWLQNPYLCDALLNEYYVPYDQTDEGTYKSLGIQLSVPSFYTDASFQPTGREILQRAAKVLVLRRRLVRVWMESENWRKTYEAQFSEMGVNKSNYCGRLSSLRFDVGSAASGGAHDESAEPDEAEEDATVADANLNDSEDEIQAVSRDANVMKYGPLSISELDETLAIFDLSILGGVTSLMRPHGMNRLKLSIKVQLLDRNWFMAAAEIHNLLLGEIHLEVIEDRQTSLIGKKGTLNSSTKGDVSVSAGVSINAGVSSGAGGMSAAGGDMMRSSAISNNENIQGNDRFDIDYRSLVTTNLGKKKLLRRILISEFSKEYKSLQAQEISENQREQALAKFKTRLIDWYHANMFEVVAEECERAEFAKLIGEMRKTASSTPHGKLLFLFSNISRHAEYFASLEDPGKETDKTRYKQSVLTQEIVSNESAIAGGTVPGASGDRLARLWYLPHLTEILLAMSGPDKPHKGPVDLSHRIFRNPQIYLKSTRIHSIIYELYTIISVFSHLLQDNRRYAASVKQLRESDYIISTVNLIKRDLMNQGEPAEYTRVLNFLNSKWQFWFLKLKYALSLSMHSLEMNMLPKDRAILSAQYDKCITKKFIHLRKPKRGRHEKPMHMTKGALVVTRTYIPTCYVFGNISSEGKRLCDNKVQEIEESIEDFFQAIQFSGSEEDINKSMMDYLTSNIKLLALRREFFRIITEGKPLRDDAMQSKCFQKYKMRILVPAVRQYHKMGSKGNASTTYLLNDDIITSNTGTEFNRIARGAFDKCQLAMLQNEIMRDFTAHMLRDAQEYFDRLTDERLGRLFRFNVDMKAPSVTSVEELAFHMSEEDYNTKMGIFNTFLSDLHHASTEFLQELRDKQVMAPMARSGRQQTKADDTGLTAVFDDKRIFACKKEFLGQAIVRFAIQLNQWKRDRTSEQERFIGALYGRLIDAVKDCERIILFQAQDKRDIMINFKREARLIGHELALDTYSELASMSVELSELRKNRKIDERKVRNKILDDYDGLVQELVREIGVLRHRFREYQIGNLNDVMNIMAEAKKEQLAIMVQNTELPLSMRETARAMIEHEEKLATLREQNHELKMTVLKIRSMFAMKEQALKFSYERQLRKISDANKEAEEKLWDSYRDAEARERALRKQMSKLQKAKSSIEFQNDLLQRQLRDEQTKPRGNAAIKAGGTGAAGGAGPSSDRAQSKMTRMDKNKKESKSPKLTELEDRLRRYEGINIDNLIQELSNKTALVEEMLQEKRDREKQGRKTSLSDKDASRRVRSARRNRSRTPSRTPSPMGDTKTSQRENAATQGETSHTSRAVSAAGGPGSRALSVAAAAEPGMHQFSSQDRTTIELNSQMIEKLHELMRENKALRRKLFLNGIPLPPESRNVVYLRSGYATPRHDSGVATSVYNSRVASPDRSRPRTAVTTTASTPANGDRRRSAGILRNSTTVPPIDTSNANNMNSSNEQRSSMTLAQMQGEMADQPGKLPRLDNAPLYQRVGNAKQVGFVGDGEQGANVSVENDNLGAILGNQDTVDAGSVSRRSSAAHRSSISPAGDNGISSILRTSISSRQRPQTAPANRRVSFTNE